MLVKEAKRLHLDVLCLSETRLLGQDNLEINGYLLVWSGQEDIHQSGVALLLKQEHTRGKMEIECISDRIIKVTLKIKGQICTMIGVNAPTNTHDIEPKIGLYSLLHKTIQSVSKKHTLFVCGTVELASWGKSSFSVVGMLRTSTFEEGSIARPKTTNFGQ